MACGGVFVEPLLLEPSDTSFEGDDVEDLKGVLLFGELVWECI